MTPGENFAIMWLSLGAAIVITLIALIIFVGVTHV